MALDQQRNWDASMADNLQAIKYRATRGGMPQRGIIIPERPKWKKSFAAEEETEMDGGAPREPVYLPDEIMVEILQYVERNDLAQNTLWACCLLSRQWYTVAVPFLYAYPFVDGSNFDPFVRAICPSINLHVRKSPLACLVKRLDMGRLVHNGSKSFTARLLGRVKDNIEEFVAPQASFASNCYPALSKCAKLRVLDLSLVSESTPLQTLFNTVKKLPSLQTLRLPRSSGFGNEVKGDTIVWPPKLQRLYLSGAIDAHFLYGVVTFPPTLHELTIEHCPHAKPHAVKQLLSTMSQADVPLTHLKIANMPRFGPSTLDLVLALFPRLQRCSVSIDYITPAVLNSEFQTWTTHDVDFGTHALRALELTNSGDPGVEDKFSPIDIMIALDDGSFPLLRQVRVAKSLGWQRGDMAEEVDALDELLQSVEEKDWEAKRNRYADMSVEEWKRADWKKHAGVWMVDG